MSRWSVSRSALIALARAVHAVFFLMTATYCLLSYSAFASQQFIRAHLIVWLTDFGVWHHLWFWAVLGVTALTVTSEQPRTPGRRLAWGYLAVSAAVGVFLVTRTGLTAVETNGRGLLFAFVALVPPLWLAIVDLRASASRVALRGSSDARVVWACLLAGGAMWAQQAVLIPWRVDRTGEIRLGPAGLAFGLSASAIEHVALFALFSIVLLATLGLARLRAAGEDGTARGEVEYWLLAGLCAIAIAVVTDRLALATIAFTGPVAHMVSAAVGVTMAVVWAGISRRRVPDVFGSSATAIDAWLAPLPGVARRSWSTLALVAIAPISLWLLNRVAALDWDFVVQKLVVVALWGLVLGYSVGVVGPLPATRAWRLMVAPLTAFGLFGIFLPAEPRLSAWSGDATFVPEFAREGYVAVDPSFRLISDLLRVDSPDDQAFYAYLRTNTVIQHVPIEPVAIDFVKPLAPLPGPKPNIFLFIVDSLRRDYVSVYNPAVGFTPAIRKFADESVVFDRSFTRYGGTAFSVPAIWSGGLLIHKQYVKPFAPMNTLFKLLDADGYRRIMSMDVVVNELLPRDPALLEIDRGLEEYQFDFCRSLDQIQDGLAARAGEARPVFAYTLSENVHISHVRREAIPPGKTYPGFEPHVASQIERIDDCFGSFIDGLRRTGLYDSSVVILTSDHGDSLGEGLRWGHSYTMFPEVMRTPLIVHVPARLRGALSADPSTVAFSTDLTPTLYRLLGYAPANLGPLFGVPLFNPPDVDLSWKRRAPFMGVSSYGAVYALVLDNGSRLYIADAVNARDFLYDLRGAFPVRIGIQAAERAANRTEIRSRIAELAHLYRFSPSS